jgi:hypothetical protein
MINHIDCHGDIDYDFNDMDFSFLDNPFWTPMMRMATYIDKLTRQSPGFIRFLNEIVQVVCHITLGASNSYCIPQFNRIHLYIPTERQQGIKFVDDIIAVFEEVSCALLFGVSNYYDH